MGRKVPGRRVILLQIHNQEMIKGSQPQPLRQRRYLYIGMYFTYRHELVQQ